ncbi:MAG: hypothetical protein ABR549_18885 [Mycobacteriales bacterium]
MVVVISARRRWLAGAVLVGVGWLASPAPVPVYDGLGAPDEPYRYVAPPAGAAPTAPPTSASTDTPVVNGGNVRGLSVQTGEQGPQLSVFLPQYALSANRGPIHISATPAAPTDAPPGTKVDGNVYVFGLAAPGGVVSLNPKYGGTATLYLRSTSQRTPQPAMYFRTDGTAPWSPLATTAGGFDVRVASFRGAGQYVLALAATAKSSGGGVPVLPLILLGILVALTAVVMVVRLRARAE